MQDVIFRAIRGIISVGLTGVAAYLWVTGADVPEGLSQTVALMIGFYFGEKASKGED